MQPAEICTGDGSIPLALQRQIVDLETLYCCASCASETYFCTRLLLVALNCDGMKREGAFLANGASDGLEVACQR